MKPLCTILLQAWKLAHMFLNIQGSFLDMETSSKTQKCKFGMKKTQGVRKINKMYTFLHIPRRLILNWVPNKHKTWFAVLLNILRNPIGLPVTLSVIWGIILIIFTHDLLERENMWIYPFSWPFWSWFSENNCKHTFMQNVWHKNGTLYEPRNAQICHETVTH